MLNGAQKPKFPLNLVQNWYEKCDPSLLASDFVCTAVGYGTRHSIYVGAEGMINEFFLEIGEAYDEWSLTVDRMIDGGQSITVLGKYDTKPKGGDFTVLPFVHVWDIFDDRIRSVTCFTDTNKSLQ